MPTFTNPSVDADEAHKALSGLAHATRSIHDPTEIYALLGSLTRDSHLLNRSYASSASSTTTRPASTLR
jgi:hypothetical protein